MLVCPPTPALGLGVGNSSFKFPKQQKKKGGRKSQAAQIVGSGDYKSALRSMVAEAKSALKPMVKQALRDGGAAVGAHVGGQVGLGGPGSRLGRDLGARLSRLIGSGDYATNKVVGNSLMGTGTTQYAQFGNGKYGTRIKHREYLFDLTNSSTSGTFLNRAFSVNPGLVASFPYLAPIAANFEEYRFHGLVFEYVSTTSEYAQGGAMGSVIMAMEYNPVANVYANKPQMENSDFAISARPDTSMVYGVECVENMLNTYLVRQGASPAPITSCDIGTMQIAVQSPLAANVNLGEVWVTYDVELFRPRAGGSIPGYAHLTSVNSFVAGSGKYPGGTISIQSAVGALSGISAASLATDESGAGGGAWFLTLPSLPPGTILQLTCNCCSNVGTVSAEPTFGISNGGWIPGYAGAAGLDASNGKGAVVTTSAFHFQFAYTDGNSLVKVNWPISNATQTAWYADLTVSIIANSTSGQGA